MVQKIKKEVPIMVEELKERVIYVASDGREFENEESAMLHEQIRSLKKIDISKLFPTLNDSCEIVYFENENQIEFYEQKACGNKDGNTWSSWVSQRNKFVNLPKWIVCSFEYHECGDEYTAFYYTLDEFKVNLEKIREIVSGIE